MPTRRLVPVRSMITTDTFRPAGTGDDYPATSSTNGTITLNRPVTGTIETAEDRDWFAMALVAGRTYTIRLNGEPSDAGTLSDPLFQGVYDSQGSLIDGTVNDDFGGTLESQVTFTPATSGTYYLAAGAYGTRTGTYQLRVSGGTVVTDIPATTSTTATLAVDGEVHEVINSAGDVDWFRVTLEAAHTYSISQLGDVAASSPLNDPYIRGLYDSQGTLLANTTNDDFGFTLNANIQYTPATSGAYYLAAGAYGDGAGAYVVTLSERTNSADRISNDTDTTGRVRLGQAGVAGEINQVFDEDWFAVTLTRGQRYEINLRGAASDAGTLSDPVLVGVYDEDGEIISGSGNDDAHGTLDSQTYFQPTTSGTYYLAAAGYGDATGTYTLSIQAAGATTSSSDLMNNANTTAVVRVGGRLASSIDQAEDVDWIRVDLTAGTGYRVQQRGEPSHDGTLTDPLILGIYNSHGTVLPNSRNDDFGSSRNAQVRITAPSTGSYYIAASAYGDETGTYTVQVQEIAPDRIAPRLVSTTPGEDETSVPLASNLSLVFNEGVRPGEGNVVLTGGGQTLAIPVTSDQVSFTGRVMTINPTEDLAASTTYQLTLEQGAVRDVAGNEHAGLTGSEAVSFTTNDGTQDQGSWTILQYFAADNDLEEYAIGDLNEMESVDLPAGVRLATFIDRTGGYDSSNGNWSGTRRGLVRHDTTTSTVSSFANFTDIGERNTGAPATLTEFIDWGTANYPADHYALIVWNHGGGLSGSAWDSTSNEDNLTASEFRTALRNASVNHFDLIGFDACLMGMAEQAWDVRDHADVFVASEELIPGEGWAYDRWLADLGANPDMTATDLGSALVSTYAEEYRGQADITLSAVRTRNLNALHSALNRFAAAALSGDTSANDWNDLRTAARETAAFPSDDNENYRDLGHFMAEVGRLTDNATLRTRARAVQSALGQAVFAHNGTVAAATGLSIYAPYGDTGVDSDYTASNHAFLSSSSWETFLASL